MAESEEEQKSLLMRMNESEKAGLKLNTEKMKIMVSNSITSWWVERDRGYGFGTVPCWLRNEYSTGTFSFRAKEEGFDDIDASSDLEFS